MYLNGLKRGATLNAVHMLITYKIVGMIEKKDFKPVYIMQGDDFRNNNRKRLY